MDFTESTLEAHGVRSLVWSHEQLVNLVAGLRFDSVGVERIGTDYSDRYDAAVCSPTGRFSVLYQRFGTEGILLDEGRSVRKLTRDVYHANRYSFPIAFSQLSDEREIFVHCPESYEKIVIESPEFGPLSSSDWTGEWDDFFQSRFALSPGGKWLLSLGWVWHAYDSLRIFGVQKATDIPGYLALGGEAWFPEFEVASATFLDDETLLVSTLAETDAAGLFKNAPLPYRSLGYYSIPDAKFLHCMPLAEQAGELMALDSNVVVSFYRHPKLLDLHTGAVLYQWDDIDSGTVISSIQGHDVPHPIALDPMNRRFAVASSDHITVVTVGTS